MNSEFLDMAYELGSMWYNMWSLGRDKIGWFLPLFGCAICLFIADAKSRSLVWWGILGLLLHFVAVFLLLLYPVKGEKKAKPKKASKERMQVANEVINPLKGGGTFQVSMQQFADSQNVEVQDCIQHFLPHVDRVGSIATSEGEAENLAETDFSITSMHSEALTGAASKASFTVHKDDASLADNITKLFIHEAIGAGEYTKAIASIAYNDGKNPVSLVKKDIFGASTFKSNNERIAADVVNQFFAVYCASKREVSSLYGLHCHKLPAV